MKLYQDIQFGDVVLSGSRPWIIAEAGVNHENSLETAFRMVEEAARAGADAIKFQSYRANRIASRFSPSYWDLSKEPTKSQRALFEKYDKFGMAEYEKLAAHAVKNRIAFMSTPFDLDYVDTLAPLVPVIKVASADLVNLPFLRRVASKGKPVVLSTGAATLGEVDEGVRLMRENGVKHLSLLHCVLSYPAKPEDAQLRGIDYLAETFPDCVAGYSDHVPPFHDCLVATLGWLRGARIIEKHFTLDKTLTGNDHYHAMDPEDLIRFRIQCDFATAAMGAKEKRVLDSELEPRKQARRSVVAARDLKAGVKLTVADLDIKRPGTGIAPRDVERLIGATPKRDIGEDEILQWDMFL
jgi:sialic acid synthase SpsE